MGKYIVILKCRGCRKILNKTDEFTDRNLAERAYNEALLNPMLGWCEDCDLKPFPEIFKF